MVCGEALIDLVAAEAGPPEAGQTFRSAWSALSAGGPMNTAIGLARLGETVDFVGRLSTDQFGQQLQAHLGGNAVSLDRATVCDDPTSLAVVSLDADGKATYAFHFAGTANFGWRGEELPAIGATDWLHVASLALVVPPGAEVLLEWAARHSGPLSLDINVRPSVIADPGEYWARVEPWLELAGRNGGVVKASDEDVDFLAAASGERGDAIATMAAWRRRFGFVAAVVTLGAEGAWATGETGEVAVPGRAVSVVDTVGAGDTFMAGFLAEYARSGDLGGAVGTGVGAAAYVCTRQGPQPPSRSELADFLAS